MHFVQRIMKYVRHRCRVILRLNCPSLVLMSTPSHPTYLNGHDPSVLRSHSWRTAFNSAAYLLPYLRASEPTTLLDVGCGPGSITVDLAALLPQGHVTGLDNSPEVLEHARMAALHRDPKANNVEFVQSDVHELPFPDSSFDVVHAHQVLQHVGDPVGALREMRRVTRHGGLVAARDIASMVWYPESAGMTDGVELFKRIAIHNGSDPGVGAGRKLHAWAREAGFEAAHITATAGTWCFHTPEEREWWSSIWAERVVASKFARMAVEGGFAGKEDLERIGQAWREWGANEDGWFAVVHGEILCRV
ncbi:UbiE family methyltransferase [Ramaria rubella]|nr:UbiE family methyltransferase [Ramaria rubella]